MTLDPRVDADVQVDVTGEAALTSAAAEHGTIDVLVNSASILMLSA